LVHVTVHSLVVCECQFYAFILLKTWMNAVGILVLALQLALCAIILLGVTIATVARALLEMGCIVTVSFHTNVM